MDLSGTSNLGHRSHARKERRDAYDTLSAPDGAAIAVWRSGETDPVSYLAKVFDELPGRAQKRPGKRRSR